MEITRKESPIIPCNSQLSPNWFDMLVVTKCMENGLSPIGADLARVVLNHFTLHQALIDSYAIVKTLPNKELDLWRNF